MKFLTDIAYVFALIAISPVAIYRMLRYKRYRAGWSNRFGHIFRKFPDKKCIWIHAVSVGEVNAATTLVRELEKELADYEIVITSTTDTGFTRAKELFGNRLCVSFFPMDFSRTMRRAFENIRPSICLLMELEVWPNLVRIAKKTGIPVVVINGRISDRGFARYRLIKPIAKKTFENITLVCAQTDDYAKKFRELGAPAEKVIITGSLKYDTAQVADKVDGADELEGQLNLKNERLLVAGGTGDGEEEIILDVYRRLIEQKQFADLRLAIVPRKPERFEEVANHIKQAGFGVVRYSEIKKKATEVFLATEHTEDTEKEIIDHKSSIINVVLGDTMGDLRKFYSLATIVFVGRSLVPMGGSDMMESAALGKCTIFGPHAFNFKQTVEDLLKNNGAIQIRNGQELFDVIQKCLNTPDYAARIARAGQQIIKNNQGATSRTIAQITQILKND